MCQLLCCSMLLTPDMTDVPSAPSLQDKEGADFQRMTWDALRKSINGLVNKVNITNIKDILPEFFGEVCPQLVPARLFSHTHMLGSSFDWHAHIDTRLTPMPLLRELNGTR